MKNESHNENDPQSEFVVCVMNTEYPASLDVRKVYRVLPDASAASHSLLRVVDETGEDYLYPASYFVPVDLPLAAQQVVPLAA
jgi:hypothetical protein